jgi:hypothetical protein
MSLEAPPSRKGGAKRQKRIAVAAPVMEAARNPASDKEGYPTRQRWGITTP